MICVREPCNVCKKLKAAFLDVFSGWHCCVGCHWHPAMAPRPLLQSWSSCWDPNHSTLQWHPAMARPLPQSSPPTIAHYNGTQQWHHVHSPKVGRWSSPSPQPYHTTMAPYDGTQQWHHVHSPNPPLHCTLQWHPGATSNQPKWFVALPPYWK